MAIQTIQKGILEYLVAEEISAPHAFTTRFGGVSEDYLFSMNLAMHRGDAPGNVERNYAIFGEELGFDLQNAVMTWQIHSDIVRRVTRADARGLDHRNYPQCDGLISNDPGTALVVFSADCTPILFHDPVTGAVGAAHAGWRGTAADIAGKTVQAMVREFGCNAADVRAAIGPNIAQCCFETDADVPQAMWKAFGAETEKYIRQEKNKYYVNLKEINAMALRRTGVKHIEISTDCTVCQSHRFWSHRVTKGHRGSQGAIIVCKEGEL